MEDQQRLARRLNFGAAARTYDAVRPGYPTRLVNALIVRAGLGRAAKVLEIGCGTGQLTRDLVRTGCEILCLEPSGELAGFARRNLSLFPGVEVREELFERFEVVAGTFDLVAAATSFHWVGPETRCDKACRALCAGGVIAILTNVHPGPLTGFFERVQDVYRAVAPDLAHSGVRSETEKWSDELTAELARSGLFDPVETLTETWGRRLSRDQYLALLETYSRHRQLPEAQRMRLFTEIGRLIDDGYGGYIDHPYLTILCMARKAQ
jgi:SAM-dependent methyltransferase